MKILLFRQCENWWMDRVQVGEVIPMLTSRGHSRPQFGFLDAGLRVYYGYDSSRHSQRNWEARVHKFNFLYLGPF